MLDCAALSADGLAAWFAPAIAAIAADAPVRVEVAVDDPDHTAERLRSAAVAGMGQGRQPRALIDVRLKDGSLVEPVSDTPLDVPPFWQHARGVGAGRSVESRGSGRRSQRPASTPC